MEKPERTGLNLRRNRYQRRQHGLFELQFGNARFVENTVLRRALRKHLLKVAAALHAIEWNDSGDGAPDEDELIRACLQPTDELRQAREDAIKAKEDLERAIAMADDMFGTWGREFE